MALAIVCGLLFGFGGAVLLGVAAESSHPSLNSNLWAALGALLGAIFGAIVGGTGAIVEAIERSTTGAEPRADRWSSRVKWFVTAVVILAAIVVAIILYLFSVR